MAEIGVVGLVPGDRVLHKVVMFLKHNQWKQIQIDFAAGHAVGIRHPAFPGLIAICIQANCVLELLNHVVVHLSIAQFDDGK